MSRRSFKPYIKRSLVVLVVIVLLLLIKGLISSIFSIHTRSALLSRLQAELSQKKTEQSYLTQKLVIAKTDSFVEREARTKLGLVKEGEELVIDQKVEPDKKQITTVEPPNWQKWHKLFF